MAILLRILLMLIIVYYILAFITRVIPSLFYSNTDYRQEVSSRKKQEQKKAKRNEGQVTIKYIPENTRKSRTDGEYTDFEEIRD
jgi:hypothetical protein